MCDMLQPLACPLRPQVNEERVVLDLSGLWDFQVDAANIGEASGYSLHLPRARLAAVPGSWNEQFSELRDYLGFAWYLKEVSLSPGFASPGRAVFLRIGSASYTATVFVNGTRVGTHEGGHLPFQFDITELLLTQQQKQQQQQSAAESPAFSSRGHSRRVKIAICVEGLLSPLRVPPGDLAQRPIQFPNVGYDFFPYAGLHRAVSLVSVPATHISDITVRTVSIDGGAVVASVDVALSAGAVGSSRGGGCIRVEAWDPADPQSAAPIASAVSELSACSASATLTLRIDSARPWSPTDPKLYDLCVSLAGEGVVADTYTLRTGFRTVQVRGDELLLNGAPLFLTGFGRHEDFPALGKGHCSAVSVKDNALVRWAGGNSFRTSHYPYDEECLELADREGLCVIDETPAVYLCFHDSDENIAARLGGCLRATRELVARDKNHPSVIMWSWANEPEANSHIATHGTQVPPGDEWRAKGRAFFEELFAEGRRLDSTRLHTLAAHPQSDASWIELCDVVCTNRYNGWYGEIGQLEKGAKAVAEKLDREHERLRRPFMLSEFGADAIAGTHAEPPEMFSEEYQCEMLERYLDLAAERPWIVGLHVWNLADFKTCQAVKRPQGLNHKGVFTRDRRPKMAAHLLRRRWFKEGAQPPAWQNLAAVPLLQNLAEAPPAAAAAGGEAGGGNAVMRARQ